MRRHYVDTLIIVCAVFFLLVEGCSLFKGTLYRGNRKVVLAKDRPDYYQLEEDGVSSKILGVIDKRAGDTIATTGIYKSTVISNTYYLTLVGQQEVYIQRSDVLTPDDILFRRLADRFKLPLAEDENAWDRALGYIEKESLSSIEIANESLIKTKSSTDTLSVSYLLTRVEQGTQVEYEIICKSLRKDFDSKKEANQLAFFMVTGRRYSWEN